MTLVFGQQRLHARCKGAGCQGCQGTGFDLGGVPVARREDPETSHEAAKTVNVTRDRALVLETLKRHGPLSDKQLVKLVGGAMSDSGARTRRHELAVRGLVVAVGTDDAPKGRRSLVWAAK